MAFTDSQTYKNLLKAYEEELMFSARYTLYREIAISNGLIEIAKLFDTVAGQDSEHARIWLRRINEGTLPSTEENLLESINAENSLAGLNYAQFVQTAREEGFDEIASLFAGVANIDYSHGVLFQKQYDRLRNNEEFCSQEETLWVCMQCGNIMSSTCAPLICPVCGFPQGYYRPQQDCIY